MSEKAGCGVVNRATHWEGGVLLLEKLRRFNYPKVLDEILKEDGVGDEEMEDGGELSRQLMDSTSPHLLFLPASIHQLHQ